MLPARLRCVALATLALSIGACSDAPTAPAVQNNQTNSGGKGTTATPVVNAPIELLHLTGGGFVTESYVYAHGETLHGFSSSILAATGPMTEPNGKCCRVMGDTVLQITFGGVPTVGGLEMTRISIELPDEPYAFGNSDVLLMLKDGRKMRYYVPMTPPTLEVISYTAPVGTTQGSLHGRISFEAAGYLQEHSPLGSTVTVVKLEGTTSVRAEFTTPMRYQFRELTIPPAT
jgi:hypothetical protein